jgi:tetratricopeptide (TPR) repeat protein
MSARSEQFLAIVALGWLAALGAGCAARGPSPQQIAQLERAHSLIEAGCYECLREALEIYERAAAAPRAPRAARVGAFQSAMLLLVRSRELGLPEEPARERARTLAAALGRSEDREVTAPLAPEASFAAFDLLTGEVTGYPHEEREKRARERQALWPRDAAPPAARTSLTPSLASDIVADYLGLAVDCDDARARKDLKAESALARHDVPLMRFRLAACGLAPAQFTALGAADARWKETEFFLGRIEMTRYPAPDVGKAAEHFEVAHAAFPASTAFTLALANARNALTEYDTALTLFDEILQVYPIHRDALLGRVMSLSYLARYYDAIATATRMIELGTYHMGDAYYWRAWNRYNIQQLDPAWDDVERATKLMVNTAVYTLAGYIAYARRELDTAIDRFVRAYQLDNTNCEAVSAEGLVHIDKEAWATAAPRFFTAIGCFASAAAQARRDHARIESEDMAPRLKERRLATLQKRIETAEHRRAQSAFNAASAYARAGQKALAVAAVDIAAEHSLLKEKALALKTAIEKLPN